MDEEIDKIIKKEINESLGYINLLNKRIDFYEHRIEFLNENKPFFFEREKMNQYNLQLKEYNDKIQKAYTQIGIEEEMIMKLENS